MSFLNSLSGASGRTIVCDSNSSERVELNSPFRGLERGRKVVHSFWVQSARGTFVLGQLRCDLGAERGKKEKKTQNQGRH